MRIDNATALVTGANRGIGLALTRALLSAGAPKIYVAARRIETLREVLAQDRARLVPLQLDVTEADAVAALPQQAPDVTLLVNNAGMVSFGSIVDVPLETIDAVFKTNFLGSLLMSRAFAPVLERNGGGAIVNVLTLLALASMPSLAAYNASKAAAWSATQSLRAALSGKGISVHAVFPSAVDTQMLSGVQTPKASPEQVAAAIVAGIAEDREDIFPDPTSAKVYAAWSADHKKIEKRFASL